MRVSEIRVKRIRVNQGLDIYCHHTPIVNIFSKNMDTLDHRVCYVTKVDMFCDRNYFYVLLQMCMAKKKAPGKVRREKSFFPI